VEDDQAARLSLKPLLLTLILFMLLAKTGLLTDRKVTTLQGALGMFREMVPSATVIEDTRFVDDGNIVTAAGSGTAIEATLHIIERLTSKEIADDLAVRYMDYPYRIKKS
jgi:transcriptional regulator GlxA family with amidase domain